MLNVIKAPPKSQQNLIPSSHAPIETEYSPNSGKQRYSTYHQDERNNGHSINSSISSAYAVHFSADSNQYTLQQTRHRFQATNINHHRNANMSPKLSKNMISPKYKYQSVTTTDDDILQLYPKQALILPSLQFQNKINQSKSSIQPPSALRGYKVNTNQIQKLKTVNQLNGHRHNSFKDSCANSDDITTTNDIATNDSIISNTFTTHYADISSLQTIDKDGLAEELRILREQLKEVQMRRYTPRSRRATHSLQSPSNTPSPSGNTIDSDYDLDFDLVTQNIYTTPLPLSISILP